MFIKRLNVNLENFFSVKKKVSFVRYFSLVNRKNSLKSNHYSSVTFFYMFLNYLKYGTLFNLYSNNLMQNVFEFDKNLDIFSLIGKYSFNLLNCYFFRNNKASKFTKFNYKSIVKLFSVNNYTLSFHPITYVSFCISTFLGYFIKLSCFFPFKNFIPILIQISVLKKNLVFSFNSILPYILIKKGFFSFFSGKIYNILYYFNNLLSLSIFNEDLEVANTVSLNNVMRSQLLFFMFCKTNLLQNKEIHFKFKHLIYFTSSTSSINLKILSFFINNCSLTFDWLKPFYFDALQFYFFFNGLQNFLRIFPFFENFQNSTDSFFFPNLSKKFNLDLVKYISIADFNLIRTYSNFTFSKSITLYSKFLEFYLLKLVGILTKRGLFLKSFSIINFFFFKLHTLNSNSVVNITSFSYFSDPFINILPQIQLTQRFLGRNNHRSVVVPRLLHLQKRIPKIFRIFLKNVYARGEHGFRGCFYFEYLELLDAKSNTFKTITDIYKQSIVNLQFIQSMKTSFVFDYRNRINPSSVNARKRVRLRDDLYFF